MEKKRRIFIQTIDCVTFACNLLEVDRDVILSQKKTKEILAKRWMIICFLRLLGRNYSQIGRMMSRDHQTVMHAVQKASVDLWNCAYEILTKYEDYIHPKMKVPNYKNSTIEVVNV